MKKLTLAATVLAAALPLCAAVQTWNNVSLVDAMCSAKVKSNPDEHKATCTLACSKSGLGILTADGQFLKFDEAGNQRAIAALKAEKRADHVRATVEGEQNGDTIRVQSIKLD